MGALEVPAVRLPALLAASTLRLFASTGMDEPATTAMIDSLTVLAEASPERLAAALEAWAKRVRDLRANRASSQVTVTHNVCRGLMGGLEVSTTLKF